MNKTAIEYRGPNNREFKQYDCTGFLVLDVLPILIGKKWNDYALGIIHAARPSAIRVATTSESVVCDYVGWRITVHINNEDIILSVKQECEVGLPEGVTNGSHLRESLTSGPVFDVKLNDSPIQRGMVLQ